MSWFSGRKNGGKVSTQVRFPHARADELVIEEVDDELLIYDKATNRAHCLSAPAAKVWRACDGYTSTEVLEAKLGLATETLSQVLDELDGQSLLEDPPQVGQTRREVTVRAARLGAAASIPFVYSVLGPIPMAAATPTVEQCEHYSGGSCGSINAQGTCASICGCCCCCSGCNTTTGATSCTVCYPASLCPSPAGGPSPDCPSNAQGITLPPCTVATCTSPGSGCIPPCTSDFPHDACNGAFADVCPPPN